MSDKPPEPDSGAEAAAAAEAERQAAAGASAAEAQAPAAEAAAQAAQVAHPGLSESDAERIGKASATATIAELERRGVFEDPAEAENSPPPAAPPEAVASGTADPAEAGEKTPGEEAPPQKRSFAQRFMGLG